MAKLDLKKTIMPAVILTAVVLALNWIFNTLGYAVKPLFSSLGPVSPITSTVGSKFLGWIGGIIPIEQFLGPGLLVLAISSYLILLVGGWIYEKFNVLQFAKGKVGRIASTVIYGTFVFYVLIVGFALNAWNVYVGLLIYTLAAAYATALIADKFKVSI